VKTPPRLRTRSAILATAAALAAIVVVPAVAGPLASPDPYPSVVVVARNDVPFDALSVGPVAAALGAPILITSPGGLSDSARAGLEAADPDVVIIAGGTAAISAATEQQIVDVCGCTVDRYAGTGRDATARLIADALDKYGVTRTVVVGDGGQVVGDVNIGGTLAVDALEVQSTGSVANLNADRLDGRDASDFVSYARTTVVSPVGSATANGQALLNAYAAVSGATANAPWLVLVEPGSYDLGATTLAMKSHVHLAGSGRGATVIRGTGAGVGTLALTDATLLRDLSVVATGSGPTAIATTAFDIQHARIARVDVAVTGTGSAWGVRLVPASGGVVHVDDVVAVATISPGATSGAALSLQGGRAVVQGGSFRMTNDDTIQVSSGGRLEITGAEIYADGTTTDFGIEARQDNTLVLAQGLRIGSAAGGSIQISDASTARIVLAHSILVDDANRSGTNAVCSYNVTEDGTAIPGPSCS
jgi:hypothetical protein